MQLHTVVLLRRTVAAMAVIAASVSSTAQAAPQAPERNTHVFVAEDRTKDADCWEQEISPSNRHPCTISRVIFVRETTLSEAQKLNIPYAAVTGQSQEDEQKMGELVAKVPRKTAISSLSTCNTGSKPFGADYRVDPSDTSSVRVTLRATYDVTFDQYQQCIVANVRDAAKVDRGSWTWLKTCIRAVDVACTTRNYTMTTTISNYISASGTSAPGASYIHMSDRPSIFKGRPYYERSFT